MGNRLTKEFKAFGADIGMSQGFLLQINLCQYAKEE